MFHVKEVFDVWWPSNMMNRKLWKKVMKFLNNFKSDQSNEENFHKYRESKILQIFNVITFKFRSRIIVNWNSIPSNLTRIFIHINFEYMKFITFYSSKTIIWIYIIPLYSLTEKSNLTLCYFSIGLFQRFTF